MSRHRWSAPSRELHRTVRVCARCAMFRVTHHDDPRALPFTTWHQNGKDIVMSSGTPACEPATVLIEEPA